MALDVVYIAQAFCFLYYIIFEIGRYRSPIFAISDDLIKILRSPFGHTEYKKTSKKYCYILTQNSC